MRRSVFAIAVALFFLAPSVADAAVTFAAGVNEVECNTGECTCSTCAGDPPSLTEQWTCPAGATMKLTDNDADGIADFALNFGGGATLTINAGCNLTIDSAGAGTITQPIRFVLPDAAEQIWNNSTWNISGLYLKADASGWTTARSEENDFFVGDLVHCPDGTGATDCDLSATAQRRIRLAYPDADYDQATGGLAASGINYDEAFGDVTAGATGAVDWVCFYDNNLSDNRVPYDHAHCYPIRAKLGDAANPYLDLDLNQGDVNQAGFLAARRGVGECRVAVSASPGATKIVLDSDHAASTCDDLFISDAARTGSFLRIGNNGTPYKITNVTVDDDDCDGVATPASGDDCIEILPPLKEAVTAVTTTALVDRGWRRGDSYFIVRPVYFVGSNASCGDNGSNAANCATMRFQGTSAVTMTAVAKQYVDLWTFDAAVSSDVTNLISFDYMDSDLGNCHLRANGQHTWRHLVTYGNGYNGSESGGHGLCLNSGRNTVRDFNTRYLGDDSISSICAFGDVTMDAQRVSISAMALNPQSANGIEFACVAQNNSFDATVRDVLIDGLTTQALFGDAIGTLRVEDVVQVGGRNSWWNVAAPGSITRALVVGGEVPGVDHLIGGQRVSKFWIHKLILRGVAATIFGQGINDARFTDFVIHNTRSVASDRFVYFTPASGVVDNFIISDSDPEGGVAWAIIQAPVANPTGSDTTVTYRRGAVVWRDPTLVTANRRCFEGQDAAGRPDGTVFIDGLLCANNGTSDITLHATETVAQNYCWWNVGTLADVANLVADGADVLGDLPPSFIDADPGREVPALGFNFASPHVAHGCGPRVSPYPGVCKVNFSMRRAGLDFSNWCADGGKFGGGGGSILPRPY